METEEEIIDFATWSNNLYLVLFSWLSTYKFGKGRGLSPHRIVRDVLRISQRDWKSLLSVKPKYRYLSSETSVYAKLFLILGIQEADPCIPVLVRVRGAQFKKSLGLSELHFLQWRIDNAAILQSMHQDMQTLLQNNSPDFCLPPFDAVQLRDLSSSLLLQLLQHRLSLVLTGTEDDMSVFFEANGRLIGYIIPVLDALTVEDPLKRQDAIRRLDLYMGDFDDYEW